MTEKFYEDTPQSIYHDSPDQIKCYANFFPKDLEDYKPYSDQFWTEKKGPTDILKNIFSKSKSEINILIPGFGLGYYEISLLIQIIRDLSNYRYSEELGNGTLNLILLDKSKKSIFLFEKILNIALNENILILDRLNQETVKNVVNSFDKSDKSIDHFERSFKLEGCDNLNVNLDYHYHNLELDVHVNHEVNKYHNRFTSFLGERKIDLVILSFILNHLFNWRSFLAYLSNFLKEDGKVLVSEIGGDGLLLAGDLIKWKIDQGEVDSDDEEISKDYQPFKLFNDFFKKKFSIISDNWEISASNHSSLITFLEHYLKNKLYYQQIEVVLPRKKIKLNEFFNMIEVDLWSTFTQNKEYLSHFKFFNDWKEKINSYRSVDREFDFTVKIRWYILENLNELRFTQYEILKQNNTVYNYQQKKDQKAYLDQCITNLYNNTTLLLDSEYNNIVEIQKLLEYKLKYVLSFVRNLNYFPCEIYASLFSFNLISKEVRIPFYNNFLRNSDEIQERKELMIDYYKKLKEKLLSFGLSPSFNNLDLMYSKYSSQFNKPFIMQYKLSKGSNPDLKINIENEKMFVLLNIEFQYEFSNLKNQDDIESILNKFRNISDLENRFSKEEIKMIIVSLLLTAQYQKQRSIVMIPIFRHPLNLFDKSSKEVRIGAFTIIFNENTVDTDKYHIIEDFLYLGSLIERMLNVGMLNDFVLFRSELLNASIKSATAAIMARNMSHNLGSHVLSYVKDDLRTQENMLKSKVFPGKYKEFDGHILKEEFEIENDQQDSIKDELRNSKNDGNYLLGLGRLVNYVQERQDFIATIAGDSPPAYATVNFKDFIFDEINYDVKAKRHSEDGMKAHTNLLLEYIARSEQLNRMKISILFNGNSIEDEESDELKDLRKIKFALPGGILGRQAFFAILENIIRNSAKHGGKSKDNGELRLNIKVDKDEDVDEKYRDYRQVTIFDNNQTIDILGYEFKEKHQKRIDGDIIDKTDGTLIQADKGLKEMKICAGWLRKIDSTEFENFDFDNKNKLPNILEAVIEEDEIKKENAPSESVVCLGYRFYIFKPKNVVLIVNEKSGIELPQGYVDEGWGIYNVDEIEENLSRIQMYDLVVYSEDCKEKIKQKQNLLPQRQMKVSTKEINNINENTNFNEQFVKFYYEWLKNEFGKEIEKINTIYIEDKNEVERFEKYNENKHESLKKINVRALKQPNDTELKEAKINPQICFKNHYSTKKEYDDFNSRFEDDSLWKGKKNYFVEGISGGNSTDRIIRREEINDVWLLKILESAFTKILIIDERIWEKLADPNPPKQKAIKILEDCLKNANNNQLTKEEKEIIRKVLLNIYTENSIKNFLNEGINNKSRLKERLEKIQEIKIVDYIVQDVYEKKNIYIYNLHSLEDDIPVFQDLSKNKEEELSWNDYDFILLHQGIIDQIYELRKNNKDKNKIGEDDYFSNIKPKQKLIVHSGRSKPEILPKNSIYIPFASIENSFFDCKQTLTELLFSSN